MHITLNAKLKQSLLKLIYASTIVASLILVVDIALFDIPNINSDPFTRGNQLQFWICLYFLFDFVLLFILADNKFSYLKRYSILVLISVPYINIFEYYNFSLSHQSFYLLKFLPILRGTIGLFLLAKLLINNKITGLFISYLALFFSIAYLQTLIFFIFEHGINPDVKTYGDVLWWASMTATTLGSNIIPMTTAGKISTAMLAITGITIFPIFTVYITSLVQNLNHKHKATE